MIFKARLSGHDFDMQTLTRLFPTEGDPAVAKDGDGYFLASKELDQKGREDESSLARISTRIITEMNGIARALESSFRPVSLQGGYYDTTRGITIAFGSATLEMRTHLRAEGTVVGGGSPVKQPPKGPTLMDVAKRNPNVAYALRFLGRPEVALNWVDLYKIYEIVLEDVGGTSGARAWVSKKKLESFAASANNRHVSGDDSRHAKLYGPPPANPMTIETARETIRLLAAGWLNSYIAEACRHDERDMPTADES